MFWIEIAYFRKSEILIASSWFFPIKSTPQVEVL
jgi:hypothetical protein